MFQTIKKMPELALIVFIVLLIVLVILSMITLGILNDIKHQSEKKKVY